MHTQSVLTITSNVVYGKSTGNTPDGRRTGRAVRARAPTRCTAATPTASCVGRVGREDPVPRRRRRHLADRRRWCPRGSAASPRTGSTNLRRHARRVLRQHRLPHERQRAQPRDAARRDGPSRRSTRSLTIRVSGYAVNFVRLTREQQMDVINRTFHGATAMMPETTAQPTSARGEEPVRAARQSGRRRAARPTSARRSTTGDIGFLHSFTTGSAVDGPGVRVVAWTAGCSCAAVTATTRTPGR